jgi:DNA-nicking Smr family endonuclease
VRSLSPDEAELWGRVTATIRPLSRANAELQTTIKTNESSIARPARSRSLATRLVGPGTTLDGTWDRRLRAGSIEPDRILDLHGMNLDTAWRAIDRA